MMFGRRSVAAAGLLAAAAMAIVPQAARAEAEFEFSAAGNDAAQANGDQQGGSGWEFTVSPYLWMAGLNGDVGTFPNLPPVGVDTSFGDILDNLDFAAMAILQARRGRFVSMLDVSYIDLGASRDLIIRDPLSLTAELDTSTLTATLAGGYRAVDQDQLFFDILAGARLTSSDSTLSLSGPQRSLSRSSSETWIDPIVAARFHAPLGGRWAVVLYGDIGGFGISSDLTWQLQGAILYQVSRHWRLSGGWRHFDVDYERIGFVYDVSQSGPILGVSFSF